MPQRKTNLNHLRILSVILKETNLSRASDILGVSQPALSSALKQLREEFHDPLLVRAGNRMELTAKARTLEAPLNDVFRAIDVLWEVESPSVEDSTRHVLIGCTDYGAFMTAAPLSKALADKAPGITVQFVDAAETKEVLNKESEFDFYLFPDVACQLPAFQDFKYIPLFDDEMVYLVGNHHRLAKLTSPSEEEISSENFACFHTGVERSSMGTSKMLSTWEAGKKIAIRVQQFSVLQTIALNSDTVVIMPRRMAEAVVETQPCTILGPIKPAFSFSFCLMWDRVFQSDEIHKYLRETFKSLYR